MRIQFTRCEQARQAHHRELDLILSRIVIEPDIICFCLHTQIRTCAPVPPGILLLVICVHAPRTTLFIVSSSPSHVAVTTKSTHSSKCSSHRFPIASESGAQQSVARAQCLLLHAYELNANDHSHKAPHRCTRSHHGHTALLGTTRNQIPAPLSHRCLGLVAHKLLSSP